MASLDESYHGQLDDGMIGYFVLKNISVLRNLPFPKLNKSFRMKLTSVQRTSTS